MGAGLVGLALLLAAEPAAADSDLRDFLTELYGGDGITTLSGGPKGTSRTFELSSLQMLGNLGEEIGSSLSAISAGGGGSSFAFDLELGVLVQTTEGFGPLVAERADTIGARRLSLGFSYTRIDFKRFEGDSLSDLSLTAPSRDISGDGRLGTPPYENANLLEEDEVRMDLDLDIEQDVFAMLGKFGITEFWDTELIVPIIRIRAHARAEATIVCNEFDEKLCKDNHSFGTPADGGDRPSSSSGGRETGIGDVLLRSKYNFLHDRGRWPDLALRGQIKLPTGDEKDLLGTGETDFQLMLIASQTWWRFTPHLNLGYELSTGPAELDNLRYAVGFEASAHRRLTLALDVVGRWAPHVKRRSDHIRDIAVGGRWNVFRSLLLDANIQIPLNRNEGLRPNFIWSLGLEYRF